MHWSGSYKKKMQAVWKNYLKKKKVDAIMSFLKAVGLYGKI